MVRLYNGEAMIHKNLGFLAFVVFLCSVPAFSQADDSGLRNEQPPIPVEEIIKQFADKEKAFKLARANYVYRQDVTIQELNANDRVLGTYQLVSDILFDDKGRRTEKVVYAPQNTLKGISLTPEDMQDLREIQPFVLTSDDIHKYKLT